MIAILGKKSHSYFVSASYFFFLCCTRLLLVRGQDMGMGSSASSSSVQSFTESARLKESAAYCKEPVPSPKRSKDLLPMQSKAG